MGARAQPPRRAARLPRGAPRAPRAGVPGRVRAVPGERAAALPECDPPRRLRARAPRARAGDGGALGSAREDRGRVRGRAAPGFEPGPAGGARGRALLARGAPGDRAEAPRGRAGRARGRLRARAGGRDRRAGERRARGARARARRRARSGAGEPASRALLPSLRGADAGRGGARRRLDARAPPAAPRAPRPASARAPPGRAREHPLGQRMEARRGRGRRLPHGHLQGAAHARRDRGHARPLRADRVRLRGTAPRGGTPATDLARVLRDGRARRLRARPARAAARSGDGLRARDAAGRGARRRARARLALAAPARHRLDRTRPPRARAARGAREPRRRVPRDRDPGEHRGRRRGGGGVLRGHARPRALTPDRGGGLGAALLPGAGGRGLRRALDVERDRRARLRGLDRRGAARAQRVPAPARARVRVRGARDGLRLAAHRLPARAAEHARAALRGGDLLGGGRDPGGVGAELPRLRRARADRELGRAHERVARALELVAAGLPWPVPARDGAVRAAPRRCPARGPRSARARPGGGERGSAMSALLEIRGLTLELATPSGPRLAVQGLDLALAPSETLALVGESGCGKTLTAQAVLGILPRAARVAAGAILWRGRDLLGLEPRARRALCGKELALSFQEPASAFDPVLTLGEQIAEPLRLHARMSRAAAWQRAVQLLEEVGLPDPAAHARRYPHELSGGQRQRGMLAMALACGPSLLIADEPTSALDAPLQLEVLALLARLRARREMALLLITHDLAVVAELAERVAVMQAGRIVEQGAVLEVFEHPSHETTKALLRARTLEPGRGPHPGEEP